MYRLSTGTEFGWESGRYHHCPWDTIRLLDSSSLMRLLPAFVLNNFSSAFVFSTIQPRTDGYQPLCPLRRHVLFSQSPHLSSSQSKHFYCSSLNSFSFINTFLGKPGPEPNTGFQLKSHWEGPWPSFFLWRDTYVQISPKLPEPFFFPQCTDNSCPTLNLPSFLPTTECFCSVTL